ncbi:uncharacterized protein LOC114534417 [Dendronephthya gigantea]|uniref:uncharacterized protein LOC114534417 n=1 Tax=Dendronephthya gigantea TaxID=151771 RepID=UPI00106C0A3F|nr:uncharacterized protein LOC114534417 [Dendronephthya gigantea]
MAESTIAVVVDEQSNKKRVKSERVWKDTETEKLISLYEARNCLWDVGNANYSNRDEKEKAYAEIDNELKEFGIDREEYKYKWKIIRGQFMREKEAERKRKSGQGADEVYVSKWKWFQSLKFLDSVKENISPTKGFDSMQKEDGSKPLPKKQKQKLKEDNEVKKMVLLDKAVSYLGAEQKQLSFTEEEHFGMLVAKTLTRLNPRQKILAKKRINDVLFDIEFHAQGAEVSLTDQFAHSEFNLFDQQHQYSRSGVNFH